MDTDKEGTFEDQGNGEGSDIGCLGIHVRKRWDCEIFRLHTN